MSLVDKLFLSVSEEKRNLSGSSSRLLEVWGTYYIILYYILSMGYIHTRSSGGGTKILKVSVRRSFG